jgi:predicted RNA-binding Zn-ribbon protein involved in translation (DUF1610 family)
MTMEDQYIDGNGIAGLLAEIVDADLTEVVRTCQSCHDRRAVGEHRAYHQSPGVVVRCPNCGDLALVIGLQEHRLVVEWHGVFEISR